MEKSHHSSTLAILFVTIHGDISVVVTKVCGQPSDPETPMFALRKEGLHSLKLVRGLFHLNFRVFQVNILMNKKHTASLNTREKYLEWEAASPRGVFYLTRQKGNQMLLYIMLLEPVRSVSASC